MRVENFVISIFLLFLVALVGFGLWHSSAKAIDNEQLAWDQCIEYEQSGALTPGSCLCARQLFTDFDHSYDWIDACRILESRNNENN